MSIKIHHGPNGAFKTSGALQDDIIPSIKQGRMIITNVRGFTIDRALAEFPDAPDSLEVLNINTDTSQGLDQARTWFQWAPKGAHIVFDEAQKLFPLSWSDAYLRKFDFEGGPDAAEAADRPADWLDAWTRHRHWNWDVVLTTPNIRYIRNDIRFTCESAFLHYNLGALGWLWRGKYKETMHSAQDNKPDSDALIVTKRISKTTFRLYESTATGQVQDTIAGTNILRNPRILGLTAIGCGALYMALSSNGGSLIPDLTNQSGAVVASPPPAQSAPVRDAPAADLAGGDGGDGLDHPDDFVVAQNPFQGRTITIKASMRMDSQGTVYLFDISNPDKRTFVQTSRDMVAVGYKIRSRGLCAADLIYDDKVMTVVCSGAPPGVGPERLGSERGAHSKRPLNADRQPAAALTTAGQAQYVPRLTLVNDSEFGSRPWR